MKKGQHFAESTRGREIVSHPLLSAQEFLNGENRWCLWLKDASPNEWRAMPAVMRGIENVRAFRLASKKVATVKLAEVPSLFAEIRQPANDYVLIPRHSSENSRFIPMAFFSKDYIVSDSCASVPRATLYDFGVLHSRCTWSGHGKYVAELRVIIATQIVSFTTTFPGRSIPTWPRKIALKRPQRRY